MYLIALYITKGKNCLSTFLFVLTLFLVSRLLSFFKSFFGSKFVFASFGVLGLFKLLLRIQLLDIFVGFWGLNFSSFWVVFFFRIIFWVVFFFRIIFWVLICFCKFWCFEFVQVIVNDSTVGDFVGL